MFHLITVMVSIAVAIIASSASLYYGGTSYTSGSAKAQALQFVGAAEQADAAWTLWEGDGNATVSGANPTQANLLAANSQGYTNLLAWPQPMSLAVTAAGGAITATFVVDNVNAVGASTGGLSTCTQIAQMAGMVALGGTLAGTTIGGVTLNAVGSTANMITVMTSYKYGCFEVSGNVTIGGSVVAGGAGDAGKFVAYFRHT